MIDNTCNGWRNAATWTVNLWFGDIWADDADSGAEITADHCRETVEQYVSDTLGELTENAGFIWDMLDLNAVDWDALAEHHTPADA